MISNCDSILQGTIRLSTESTEQAGHCGIKMRGASKMSAVVTCSFFELLAAHQIQQLPS